MRIPSCRICRKVVSGAKKLTHKVYQAKSERAYQQALHIAAISERIGRIAPGDLKFKALWRALLHRLRHGDKHFDKMARMVEDVEREAKERVTRHITLRPGKGYDVVKIEPLPGTTLQPPDGNT